MMKGCGRRRDELRRASAAHVAWDARSTPPTACGPGAPRTWSRSWTAHAWTGETRRIEWRSLLADPQTSGGLLMAVGPDRAPVLLDALAARGETGVVIGRRIDGQRRTHQACADRSACHAGQGDADGDWAERVSRHVRHARATATRSSARCSCSNFLYSLARAGDARRALVFMQRRRAARVRGLGARSTTSRSWPRRGVADQVVRHVSRLPRAQGVAARSATWATMAELVARCSRATATCHRRLTASDVAR